MMEKNPTKVMKKIKTDFLRENFLSEVSEDCKESVKTALEMSEFNKKVILA